MGRRITQAVFFPACRQTGFRPFLLDEQKKRTRKGKLRLITTIAGCSTRYKRVIIAARVANLSSEGGRALEADVQITTISISQ